MKKRALTYLFLLCGTMAVLVAEVWIGASLKAPVAVIIPLAIVSLVPLILYVLYPYITQRWIGRVQRNGRQTSAVVLEFQDYMAGIGHYEGSDLWIDLPVRVDAERDGEFEARMKCRLSQSYVLKEGMSVTVKYDPADKRRVVLMDDVTTILNRRTIK
jgi:hypothetical protein